MYHQCVFEYILCEVGEKVWWKISVRFSQNKVFGVTKMTIFFPSLFDSMKINEHHFKKLKWFERRRYYQSRYCNWNIKEYVKKKDIWTKIGTAVVSSLNFERFLLHSLFVKKITWIGRPFQWVPFQWGNQKLKSSKMG